MVVRDKVNPFRYPMLFALILINVNTLSMVFNGSAVFNEVYTLHITNLVMFLSILFQGYYFIKEFKDILNINLLVIPYKKSK